MGRCEASVDLKELDKINATDAPFFLHLPPATTKSLYYIESLSDGGRSKNITAVLPPCIELSDIT